jgi:hypothetical protein
MSDECPRIPPPSVITSTTLYRVSRNHDVPNDNGLRGGGGDGDGCGAVGGGEAWSTVAIDGASSILASV